MKICIKKTSLFTVLILSTFFLISCGGVSGSSGNSTPQIPVSMSMPNNNQTGVSTNLPQIRLAFGAQVDNVNTNTLSLHAGSQNAPVTSATITTTTDSSGNTVAIISPDGQLDSSTQYYVVVGSGITGTDVNGQVLATDFSFTTKGNALYIVNNSESVSICSLNENSGTINNCTLNNVGESAYNIAINPSGTYAYTVDMDSAHISVCDLDQLNGQLSNCHVTIESGLSAPTEVSFNADGSYAYIVDYYFGKVFVCTVNVSNGSLSNCTDSGATFTGPASLAISSQAENVYVTNNATGKITSCDIDKTTGLFSNCNNNAGTYGINGMADIVFGLDEQNVYITNRTVYVQMCSSQPNGTLSNCVTTGNTLENTVAITFNSSKTYAYLPTVSNQVLMCGVSLDGSLNNCTDTAWSGLTNITGIAIY